MKTMLQLAWGRLSIYLPILLMGVLALGSYWLLRNTPMLTAPSAIAPPTHEADYFMRDFSVKNFDALGHLKSEVFGTEARHFPDTDTVEIKKVRIRSVNPQGMVTVSTADKGLSNGDGSEVQLFGNAVVVRQAVVDKGVVVQPQMEFRSDFLHAFLETERMRSNKPVTLVRGADVFTADSMDYNNLDRLMQLEGRVKGVLIPQPAP